MGFNLSVTSESFGTDKRDWLGSAEGVSSADSGTLDADKFVGTFTDGVVPSGVAVRRNTTSGLYEPAANVAATGDFKMTLTRSDLKGTTAGTAKDTVVALLWHGQIIEAKLPTNHGVTSAVRTGLPMIDFIQ